MSGGDRAIARLALSEEASRRGVRLELGGNLDLASAAHWLRTIGLRQGRQLACSTCGRKGKRHLLCSSCDLAMCPQCLGISDESIFDIGFQCISCSVSGCVYDFDAAGHRQLRDLHAARLVTLSQRLKPATWLLYQSCINDIQRFIISTGAPIFPILTYKSAELFTLFLEQLKTRGYSWSRLRAYRSAVSAFHKAIPGISAEAADPFRRFPLLDLMWSGLHRSVSTVVTPRRPLAGKVVIFMIQELFSQFGRYLYSQPRQARIGLRNAAILILGFFGMRRSAELFCSANRDMGLLIRDVHFIEGDRIELFIRSMKNDTYAEGNTIALAWFTASGVPIGPIMQTYVSLLLADGLTADDPLFSPTRGSSFIPVPAGKVSRFNHIVKDLLRFFLPSLAQARLAQFSFHSLRRGGASYARMRGVPLGLILAQGLWSTIDGARSYIVPSPEERTLATSLM